MLGASNHRRSAAVQDTPITITNIARDSGGTCTYEPGGSCVAQSVYSATIGGSTGTIIYNWSVDSGASIVGSNTTSTVTVNGTDSDSNDIYNVTLLATDDDSNDTRIEGFADEKTDLPLGTFVSTWRTTTSNETVVVPLTLASLYGIDWGDGTVENGLTTDSPSHSYVSAGDHVITITDDYGRLSVGFHSTARLQLISVSEWSALQPTSGDSMFNGCINLTTVVTTGLDTSQMTSVTNMFGSCTSLTSLDVTNFDIGNLTSFLNMFTGCTNLAPINISGWDTSAITDLFGMFSTCYAMESNMPLVDDITLVTRATNMYHLLDIGTAKYTQMLIDWNAQSHQSNVTFSAGVTTYTSGATAARAALVSDGWTITDGGLV